MYLNYMVFLQTVAEEAASTAAETDETVVEAYHVKQVMPVRNPRLPQLPFAAHV